MVKPVYSGINNGDDQGDLKQRNEIVSVILRSDVGIKQVGPNRPYDDKSDDKVGKRRKDVPHARQQKEVTKITDQGQNDTC